MWMTRRGLVVGGDVGERGSVAGNQRQAIQTEALAAEQVSGTVSCH
jgi:hypothetical protein